MSPRLPPRREPRVLAFVRSPTGFRYAVADLWEIRSAGSISCRAESLNPAMLRIARREKPTLIVPGHEPMLKPAHRVAHHLRVALVSERLPWLPPAIAHDLYPELAILAPTRELAQVASIAISAALYANVPSPSRHYAKHKPSSPTLRRTLSRGLRSHERSA